MFALIAASCIAERMVPTPSARNSNRNHTLEQTQGAEPIWSANNIYIIWNKFDNTLSAESNQVCYLGGQNFYEDKYLTCLNGYTGKLLWKIESGIHRALKVTPNEIFVIYSSSAGVKKYDRSTGNIEWSRLLDGSGCYYFYIVDNELQISTNPTNLLVLDFNGNLKKEFNAGTTTYISTHNETFIRLNGLISTETDTSKVKWEFREMDNLFDFMPVFSDDKIFVRTGLQLGSVYALDRKSGNLLWKTSGVISNVVYSVRQHSIYALTEDGNLVAFDDETGNKHIIASFTSVPFFLIGDEGGGSYHVAFDEEEYILFVYTGDSKQLFAFQEE
jgi:outer membrane protein assembly factor BamB